MPATLNTMHEPDAVTAKAAALLKAEYLCGREIAQAVETLQKTLLESTSGKGVREEAKALEVLLQKLAKIGQHTDAFLHAARKDSLAAVLAAAPPSPLREKALMLASVICSLAAISRIFSRISSPLSILATMVFANLLYSIVRSLR